MPAPNFDPAAYHMLMCGVPGVAYEQNGCYYNIRHEYVKPSGRKRAEHLAATMPANSPRARSVANVIGAVPDTVESVSKENEKAAKAEEAAD